MADMNAVLQAVAIAQAYTDEEVIGGGAIKGKNCTIPSIDEIEGGHRVNFKWTLDDGTERTGSMTVMDGQDGEDGQPGAPGQQGEPGEPGENGRGIKHSYVDENEHFIIVYDDDTEEDCGKITVIGGDSTLTTDVTSNLAVGAIASGTTLPEGTTFTEFAQKLLISEIAPTTTFTASGSGTKEVGTSVTPTLTLNITNKGTGTPVAIKFYSGSTLLDSQNYVDGTNTYTFTMASAITTTTTVKGVLEYKKSDSSSASIEKTATYTFVMASYYGAVATAPTDKAGIIALTKNVKTGKGQTATFTLNNQRSCYAYPASMGNLTSIKDANNFEYLSSYTKTSVTVDDVAYNVYTLTDPVTATGFKQVYA